MHRKTIFIALTIFILLVLGLFVWLFFASRNEGETVGETIGNLFPFGESGDRSIGGEEGQPQEGNQDIKKEETSTGKTGGTVPTPVPFGLRQLTTVPIGGIAFASTTENKAVLVYYVERQTGHIYEVNTVTEAKRRISNTTVPGIRELVWGGENTLVLRYLDENDVVKSFSATIKKATSSGATEGTLDGRFLADDISQLVSSPSKTKILGLSLFGNSVIGTISKFNNTERKEVFNSPHTEWLVSWPEENTIALATKPSKEAQGFLYFLNLKTNAFEKIIGGVLGLTALVSPDLQFILYTESLGGTFKTSLYKTKEHKKYDLYTNTLPEKCVWSKISSTTVYCGVSENPESQNYPDAWYQGLVSLSDSVWKINVETGALEVLAKPIEVARQNIDLIHPILSEKEDYLIFVNKNDSTLWSLKLTK